VYPPPEHQEGLPQQLPRTSPLGPHPWHFLQGLSLAQLGPQLLHVLHHVAHVPEGTRNAPDSGLIILPKNCRLEFRTESDSGNFSYKQTGYGVHDNSYPDKSGKQNFGDKFVDIRLLQLIREAIP